jgi:hypothetical protein
MYYNNNLQKNNTSIPTAQKTATHDERYTQPPSYLKKGDSAWWLWHSYKNENALPLVIFLTIPLIICYGGIFYIAILWLGYMFYCCSNNEALNNDPHIIEKREAYIFVHEKNYKFF